MKKILLFLMFFLFTFSVSGAIDFYASENLTIHDLYTYDTDIYILGVFTNDLGITTFGYYTPSSNTYINRSTITGGTTLGTSTYNDISHNNIFKGATKEVLCFLNSLGENKCWRFSEATSRWIEIVNNVESYVYGNIHYDTSTIGYNVLSTGGINYYFNSSSGTAYSILNSAVGRQAKITYPDTDSQIYFFNGSLRFTLNKNTTGHPPYFSTNTTTGLNNVIPRDIWSDETNFYAIITNNIYLSSNGLTFSEIDSASCNDILALTGLTLNSIDCKDSDECLIGGEYGTQTPLLFEFNGVECTISGEFNYEISTNTANASLLREIYDIQYSTELDEFIFGGLNIFGSTGGNFSLSATVSGNIFDSAQCVQSGDLYYLCTDTIYNEDDNSFLCALENYNICSGDCVQFIYNVNESTLNSYSPVKSCSLLEQKYNYGFYVDCYLTPSSPSSFEDYINNICSSVTNTAIIPTSTCGVSDVQDYIDTNDTLYIYGQCVGNYTPVLNQNLCNVLNQTVCADNTHVQKCVYDERGYTIWNLSETCTSGLNIYCVAGACQYVAPQCFKDGDCATGKECDLATNQCVDPEDSSNDDFSLSSFPQSWRYVIMIIISMLALILPMLLGGREGVLAGLAFSAVICLALTIVFQLSIVIPIVYIVLAGGVFAVIVKSTIGGQ